MPKESRSCIHLLPTATGAPRAADHRSASRSSHPFTRKAFLVGGTATLLAPLLLGDIDANASLFSPPS
jgi:hypothetical protein